MADWTDGPEYAPAARPQAFVAPRTPALIEQPRPAVATDVPRSQPQFQAPQESTPDLRTLVPSVAPRRNPTIPFESVTTPLTSASLPPGDRDPQTPFSGPGPSLSGYLPVQPAMPAGQANPTPLTAPNPPAWPIPNQPPQAAEPVTFAQIFQATTPTVVMALVAGTVLFPISPIALAVASISTSQVRYRTMAVRFSYGVAWFFIAGLALLTTSIIEIEFWTALCLYSSIGAFILLLVTATIVGRALHRREPPDRP